MRYAVVNEGSLAVYDGGSVPDGAIALTGEQHNGILNGTHTIENGDVIQIVPAEKTPQERAAELVEMIELAIDLHIDKVARDKGYGTATMSPTAACISYAGYENIYQFESVAFGVWKANIWPAVHQIYADVQNGLRQIPTAEEVIAELDLMVWPEGD